MYFSELKKTGYKGSVDGSLDISLYEYGLVHKKTKTGYDFIHGTTSDGETYLKFDHASMTEEEFDDMIKPGGWFNLDSILSYVGLTSEEWKKLPLPSRVHDCIRYYGHENIFASVGYEFEITTNQR